MIKRLEQINENCALRGVAFTPSVVGSDVVLSVNYTRKLPENAGRKQALDKRYLVFRDGLKAVVHAAQIYNSNVHVLLSRRDPVDVARNLGFHPNLLSVLSNGLTVEPPPYYQLYSYRGTNGK